MTQKKSNRWLTKAISLTIVFTFISPQVLPAGWAESVSIENQNQIQIPEKAVSETPESSSFKETPKDSVGFLQDNSPLSAATPDPSLRGSEAPEAISNPVIPTKAGIYGSPIETFGDDLKVFEGEGEVYAYDYARYDFKDALDLLRPEYATAVIVKNFTAEDLNSLVHLSFETGIIVLHGEIVLFTSGSEDEIGVLPAVKGLLQKATFISHTHVDEFAKEGPSGEDLNEATLDPEYVITRNGVYAYNHEGILNNGDPYSYDWYLDRLNQAVTNPPHPSLSPRGGEDKSEGGEIQARADLNQFIKDQDQYNQAPESQRQTLLMGGTLANTSGLTSANVTTLPGSPYPYFMTGSSSATTLSLGTDGRLQLGYNVSTTGSYSGMTISFDNATTTAVETQNLSTFTNVVFGLQGPATAVKLEFVDINGNKDSYTLTNVSSTLEQFWSIATSTIVSTVDKTRIKQINLFVDQSTTTSTTLTGTIYIRSNGLNISAPTQPVVTTTIPVATNQTTFTLSGTKDANASILINGTEVIARNSSTSWSYPVNLSTEGNNTFNITEKNSIGKLSTTASITVLRDTIVPTGSININSGATYANSATVTLNLSATDSGSGINTMSFSNDNVTYSTPEAYNTTKTYTLPTGDGTKTVYVKFYDKAGNVSTVYSKSIVLDTVPPTIKTSSSYFQSSAGETGYWNFDNSTVVGTTVTDQSGSGNNGTLVNSPLISTDHPTTSFTNSGSLSFNGVNNYVQVTNNSNLNFGSGDFSISLWIRPNTISTLKQGIVDKTDGTNGYRLITSDTDGSRLKFIRGYYFADGVQSTATLSAVAWYHIVVVINGSTNTVTFYINGVNGGSGTLAAKTALSAADLFIGQKGYSASTVNNFNGNIDDLRICNRALSSQEIQSLASGNQFGSPPVVTTNSVSVDYTVDGVAKTKTFTNLAQGTNNLTIVEQDPAGNQTTLLGRVTYTPTATVNPPTVNVVPTYTNSTTFTLNGTKPTNTSVWINGSQAVPIDSLTTWSYPRALVEGLNSFSITTKDSTGSQSTAVNVSLTRDTIIPTGSININSNALYTNSTSVTLNLSSTDSGSGLDKMSFSQDNSIWSAPETYATTKSGYSLTSGDGNKTVYVKYYDKAGNISAVYSKSITLDTIAPLISSVTSMNVSSSAGTIMWTTNEASDSQIEYGTTASYGSSTTIDSTLVTAHSQTLSNLQASMLYHYRVKSKDAAGNLQVSPDYTFQYVPAPVEAVKFTDLTQGAAKLQLLLNSTDFGGNVSKWSYSIDGGAYSALDTYGSSKIISIPEGSGLHTIDVKFYDSLNNASQVYRDKVSLDAVRAVVAFNPAAATQSLKALIEEGLLRTDQYGNFISMYDRDLLDERTTFAGTTFRINAPTEGATLPSLNAEFEIGASTPTLALETGFSFPDQFVRGKLAQGTAKLVIEDGFFKLKIKRPHEELVDGVPFLVDREEIIVSKLTPTVGKRYGIQFDFTLAGLEIYLDEGGRGIVSKPLFVLEGAQANPYLDVQATNITLRSTHIYGNSKKVLTSDNQIHDFAYTRDANGKLTQVIETIRLSRFTDTSLASDSYTLTKTFDVNGQLLTQTDRNGETIRYTYDVSGKLTKREELANGRVDSIVYTDEGAGVTRMNETLQYTDGFLNSVNAATTERFNSLGQRLSLVIPSGKSITFSYSGAIVTAAVTDGSFNHSLSFTTDASGRPTRIVNRSGVIQTRTYTLRLTGEQEVVIGRDIPDGALTYHTTERIVTGRDGKVTETQDREGHIAKYTYDNDGDLTRYEDGWGRITTWTYTKDVFSGIHRQVQTTSLTDDFGNVINSTSVRDFDQFGNVSGELDADGSARVYVYEYHSYNHGLKSKTTYFYKGVSTIDQLWTLHATSRSTVTSRIEWNELGEVTLQLAPNSVQTRFTISHDTKANVLSNLQTISFQDGSVSVSRTSTQYFDLHGNVTKQVDFNGNEDRYSYDLFDQLISTTHHYVSDLGTQFDRVTTFLDQRNAQGILLKRQQTETFQDGFGNSIQKISATAYDTFGNVTQTLSANGEGQVIEYEFRTDGRILSQTVYRYEDVHSLTDVSTKHTAAKSMLKEKTVFNLLGEVVHRETFDEKTIDYVIEHDTAGRIKKRTANTNWIGEDGRSITTTAIQEWDLNGNLTRQVSANGDELLYTYGVLGAQTKTIQNIPFGGSTKVTTTTFSESRASSGLLLTQSQRIQGVDGFLNAFDVTAIQKFNEFGEMVESIDRSGKGQVIEYTRFAWDDVQEIRTYEYNGVNDLASLEAQHALAPRLIDRTKSNFLGETIETENKDHMITRFEKLRRTNGELQSQTRRVTVPNATDKVFLDEFNVEGKLTRSTDDQGIVTSYIYAIPGEVLSQVETGTGTHSITTNFSTTRYAYGLDKVVTKTTTGIDRFGRQVNLQTLQEFSSRGDLAYFIDETDDGKVIVTERDDHDRIKKKTTTELKDGVGFLAYAKANLSASTSLTHLNLDLLKSWFSLLSTNSTVAAQFPAIVTTEEWDKLGNQITNDQKQERLEKTILTNSIGGPSEIKNQTYFSLGTNGPTVRTAIEAKAFVSVGDLPKITVAGTQMNLSALTSAGIALVILPGGNLAGAITKTYTTSQISTLTTDLNARLNGDLVILVTRGDAGKSFNEALFAALEAFGSAKVRGATGGGAFSFIGVKGNTHAQTIEDYQERPGDTAQAINFRTTREVYDLRGSLTHYEDGLGNILDYIRGFDGEALTLTETRQQDSWQRTTTYQKIKDVRGRVLSTQEAIVETTPETFDDPESFPRNWDISNAGGTYSIQTGRLTVDPLTGRWMSSIYPQAADNHELTGDLKLEVNQNAEIGFWLRYISTSQYLGLRVMKDRIRLILHENQNETILNEVLFASQLLANASYTFDAKMEGTRVVFTLNGSTVFDYTIPTTTIIPSSGTLSLNLEKGKASFDNLTAIRRLVKGRTFGGAEILTQRIDQAGVTTSFNSDGDIVRVDDPANSTVRIYEIEKYATGSLKRKKETISVTAKNVDGQNVTTTLSTESQYDVNGHLIRFIDTAGKETLYTYTLAGETASTIFPDGTKIDYSYSSNTQTGSRTITEIHSQAQKNAAGVFILDALSNLIYDEQSRVIKTYNKDGDLIFLSEYLTGDQTREEIDFTYQYWPGAERKLKRKDATHRFIDINTNAEVLRYVAFEERDIDGLITHSVDDQGVDRQYQYRELVRTGQDNLKRIATIRETRAGDVTMHYYFYRSTDSYSTLQYTPPQYWDLDQDETGDEANDLDFVIQVRDRGTVDKSDDEIQVFQYSGSVGNERVEKRILYQLGGMTSPDKESSYVYHYDGALDQIVNYQYDYLYNSTTGQLDRQPKRLESATTYKADATGSPRIDKVTDAFTIKNYFYTSTGRLDRVEETNGTFPNRVTTSKYNSVGDIISVTDFYGRITYYEYVKNSSGKNIALFETNNQDQGRIFRMFAGDGELALEMDRNGRMTLFDSKPHPSQLGKTTTETQYFLKDSNGWLTPWFLNNSGNFNSLMATLDRNGNGQIEDSDLQALFNSSNFPAGTTLARDKTYKVLNAQGDLVLSLSPEGLLSGYDYAKDILEAKRQTQWAFYKTDPTLGYLRIDLDGFDASVSSAWTLLGEKLLKAGGRDYQELTSTERAAADTSRQAAWSEFLIGLAKISSATDLDVVKTVRRHNSNGELIEEIDSTGLSRQTIYSRDTFGVPQASFVTNSRDGAVIYQEFNHDGEVVRQRLTNGLVKEFTYTKDTLGNTSRVTERTIYPHDPQGQGSLETRDFNLAGETVKVTDRNAVVTDITTREDQTGAKEILRTSHFTDTFNNPINFTELERLDRYGNTIYRQDRNGHTTTITYKYDALGRISESVETTNYTTQDTQAISYQENFRFNQDGQQTYMKDKNGREVTFEYVKDAYGNTTEIREREVLASGIVALTVRKLSSLGELLSITDKNGFTVAYSYDKDPLGNVTSSYESVKLRYDFSGDRQVDDRDLSLLMAAYGQLDSTNLQKFDLTGNGVIDEEDAKVLTQSREYGTREVATKRQFSQFGDLLTLTDRNSRKLFYTYTKDALGNVTRSVETTDQFQGSTTRVFNRDGQIVQMKDQNSNTVRYTYTLDSKGNVLGTREDQELAASVLDPKTEQFDSQGRQTYFKQGTKTVTTTYNLDGSYIQMEYDANGLVRETRVNSLNQKTYEKLRSGVGQNFALGVQLTTTESLDTTNVAARLVDGVHNRTQPWLSKNKTDGILDSEFVRLDLGSTKTISEVRVDTGRPEDPYFVRSFDVSVSADGITWKKVGTMTNLTYQGVVSVSFPDEVARYVKIHNLQSWQNDGTFQNVGLNEVEVFGPGWAEQNDAYSTDVSGNVTMTATDAFGAFIRQEIKDSLGRVTYVKEKKIETSNAGFGSGVTVSGDAKLDTTQSKFGGASAVFDGLGDSLSVPDSSDFDFGTGDFTIDTWVNFSDAAWFNGVISKYMSSTGWIFTINTSSGTMTLYDSGSSAVSVTSSFLANTWYHVAVLRSGSAIKFFKDGLQQGTDQVIPATRTYNGAATPLKVGMYDVGSGAFKGRIDELRVSKGIARWTANFTPPASEYAYDVNTKLLLHMNGNKIEEQWTSYSTAQGNTTATTIDFIGLLKQEIRDSQGRLTYLKARNAGSTNTFNEEWTTYTTDSLGSTVATVWNSATLRGNTNMIRQSEEVRDIDGKLIRTDQHMKQNGQDVVVLMGDPSISGSFPNVSVGNPDFGSPIKTFGDDLTSALPITAASSSSAGSMPQAFDGKFDGSYAHAAIGGSITFTLADPTVIGRMDSYFHRTQGIGYQIQASLDGVNWYTVLDKSNGYYKGLQSDTFNPVKSKYLRIQATKSETNLSEFNLEEAVIYPPKGWPVTSTVSRTFNIQGDLLSETQKGGRSESFAYEKDSLDNVTRVIETHNKPDGSFDYVTSRYFEQEILAGYAVRSITPSGDVKIDTSSSKFGGASAVFDGLGDSLSVPDSSDFDFGTGDFTVDTWVNFSDVAWFNGVISKYMSSTGWIFTINTSSGDMTLYDSGNSSVSVRSSFSINTWYHVAVVRSGSAIKFFKDGLQQGLDQAISATRTFNGASAPLKVGIYDVSSGAFKGRIDEVRVSKGIARWTSNFTPPASEYTYDVNTKLLLHMNGPNGSTNFQDAPIMTRACLPKECSQTASIDRDGKLTRYSYEYDALGNQVGIYQLTQRGGAAAPAGGSGLDSKTEFSGEVRDTFGRVIKQIADSGEVTYFTYDLDAFGNIKRAYVRNTEPETVSVRQDLLQPTGDVRISAEGWTNTQLQSATKTNYLFDGNSATGGSVSISSGQVKPIEFNFSGIPSVTAVGDAQVDTDQFKFGGASAFFDGSGDYLSSPDHSDFDFGSGDFTIDTWIRFRSMNGAYTISSKYDSTAVGWIFVVNPLNKQMILYDSGQTAVMASNVTFNPNTWYHVAVERKGSVIKFFKDGAQQGSDLTAGTTYNGAGTSLKIGIYENTSPFDGWMDEFRISKGLARWAANFTLPTQEYTPDASTKLLLHMNGPKGSKNFAVDSFAPPKKVDVSRIRFLTNADPNLGYRIETTQDGVNWSVVIDQSTGGLKAEWHDHEFSANQIQKLKIVPVGYGAFTISEIQIFSAPQNDKNYQVVRDYDGRGNIKTEKNILRILWEQWPELKAYFPDPEKKGLWGRWKDKTILDWAHEEGWLMDPRLHNYMPQLDFVTPELKDAFDSRRELQRRFTNEAGLVSWATTTGSLTDQRLDAYKSGRTQDNTVASGLTTTLPVGARETVRYGQTVEEWQPIYFDQAGTNYLSVIDGTIATGDTLTWGATEAPKSFVVKLDSLRQIGMSRFKTNGDGTTGFSYSIEASKDGQNWFTVVDKTSGRYDMWQEDYFSPVTALYLKITGDRDTSEGRSLSIYEIEAYEKVSSPIPIAIDRTNASNVPIQGDNALFLVWKANPSLQKVFPSLTAASILSGRWNGKTLLDWARLEGYKHYANLASYAPVGTTDILPGLRQVFDDGGAVPAGGGGAVPAGGDRTLQDKFRKNGTKDTDLIQYARYKGYREDSRLFHYGPMAASGELPHSSTFETKFDLYGNQAVLIAKDDFGTRTWRHFGANGRLIEQKPELLLLWQERPDLYLAYTTSDALRTWAVNTGSKDSAAVPGGGAALGRALNDYSAYAIGASTDVTTLPLPTTMQLTDTYDPAGFLKETKQSQVRLEGTELRFDRTLYDPDGNEIQIVNTEGTFTYTLTKDRQGRVTRRQGSGAGFASTDEWFATDQSEPAVFSGIKYSIIANFLFTNGRLPTADELTGEQKFISEKGQYASRARLSLTTQTFSSVTAKGQLDPSLVQNYGMTSVETAQALSRAAQMASDRTAVKTGEDSLESKYLGTLVQKTFRRLLGRDASETIQTPDTELNLMITKLKTLNSQVSFEQYLTSDYNKDSSGVSEHNRRTSEIQSDITNVYSSLQIYFGLINGTLDPKYLSLLKILRSDPSFTMKDLNQAQLDQIKQKLLTLTTEDIHFGQSAVYSIYELLKLKLPASSVPTLAALTSLALFSDILTGVISPEFEGNLQFSAYTLKALSEIYSVKTIGLKLSWSDLVKIVQSGYSVIVNIEQRHFVLVTQISGPCLTPSDQCLVTFLENGYTRTKTAAEFNSQWFGVVLVDQSIKTDSRFILPTSYFLSSSDLLKVKGAGWFKKLFRKIIHFFQRVIDAVVNVIQKVVQAVVKFFATTAGKIIGSILLGPIGLQLLNFGLNSASYGLKGDFKGLIKYWGSNILTLASLAIQLIPVVGQIFGAAMQFLGNFLQMAGAFLGAAGSFLGGFVPVAGGFINGALQLGGRLLTTLGSRLIQAGTNIMNQANSFLKDLKSNNFSRIKELFKPGALDDFKAKVTYGSQLPDGVRIKSLSSSAQFLNNIENQLRVNIPAGTNHSISASLVNILLDTAVNAALGAIEGQAEKLFSSNQTQVERTRAPPINAPTSRIDPQRNIISLKDPNRTHTPLTIQNTPFGRVAFAYDDQGTPIRYQSSKDNIPRPLQRLNNNRFRADIDEGNFTYLKYDPNSQNPLSSDQIGNRQPNDPRGPNPPKDSREEKLLQDPKVQRALAHAIRKSTSNPKNIHEEGGFILQDSKGKIAVRNLPAGGQASLRFPPYLDGRIGNREIIGSFHTHPNAGVIPGTGFTWDPRPSDRDIDNSRNFPKLFGRIQYVVARDDKIYAVDNQGNFTEVGDTNDLFK